MRIWVVAPAATVVLSVVFASTASADPVKSPYAEFLTVDCEGHIIDIVVGLGSQVHMINEPKRPKDLLYSGLR